MGIVVSDNIVVGDVPESISRSLVQLFEGHVQSETRQFVCSKSAVHLLNVPIKVITDFIVPIYVMFSDCGVFYVIKQLILVFKISMRFNS